MPQRRGITLLETVLALVTLTIGFTALLRAWVAVADGVGVGRRWTLMTVAAQSRLARLEAAYRVGAPACVVPAGGTDFTPDGIGLDWTTADSSGQLAVVLEVRAAQGGRLLADTVGAQMACR